MEQGLKERMVGAAVLVILAVIFIPMFLGGDPETDRLITETNIPERPSDKSGSRIVPLEVIRTVHDSKSKTDAGTGLESDISKEETPEPVTEPKPLIETEKNKEVTGRQQSKRVGLTAWIVQLGSFSDRENAEQLNEKLRKGGYPAFVEPLKHENTTVYRVRVGPELLRSDAEELSARLKSSMKLEGIILRYP